MDILAQPQYAEAGVDAQAAVSSYPTLACPRCGDRGLVRSQPRWWDMAIRAVTHRRPFRCFSCQSRRWWHVRDVTKPIASSPVRLP